MINYIGNDIISFTSEENIRSFNHPGYFAKILSGKELEWAKGYNLSVISSLFWTVKESAYKVFCKCGNLKAFSPRNFHIQTEKMKISDLKNSVMCHVTGIKTSAYGLDFYSVSEITRAYCHTLTCLTPFCGVLFAQEVIANMNKKKLYDITAAKCMETIAKQIETGCDELQLARNEKNIPVLLKNGLPLNVDVSLSYDDNLAAYAFIIQ